MFASRSRRSRLDVRGIGDPVGMVGLFVIAGFVAVILVGVARWLEER
jgi:hypothetical protein